MLDDAALEALKLKFGKVGVVDFDGHQIVFRKPTRDQCREYRRMRESANEKHESLEHLAQMMIVAFDGTQDPNLARTLYTSQFLEDYPLFVNVPKVAAVLSALSGMVEEEDAQDLGKGVRVLSVRRPNTPQDSRTGSATAASTSS